MYKGKREIFNLKKYNECRKECLEYKADATDLAFSELEGIINQTQLSKQYFQKSPSWLSRKLNGCAIIDNEKAFSEDEYHQLADAFRDIAKRLLAHADEIDDAKFG